MLKERSLFAGGGGRSLSDNLYWPFVLGLWPYRMECNRV